MNRKALQKAIDALNGTEVKIDYVRGILETLLDSLPEDKIVIPVAPINPNMFNVGSMSESQILEKETQARIKNIKDIAHD